MIRPATRPLAQSFLVPNHEKLDKKYREWVKHAQNTPGVCTRLDGPPVERPQDYPAYDITPDASKGGGFAVDAYLINGRIYEKSMWLSPPLDSWWDCGPAPKL